MKIKRIFTYVGKNISQWPHRVESCGESKWVKSDQWLY